MRRWIGLALVFSFIFCGSLPSVQAEFEEEIEATIYEQEPNDSFSTANHIELDDVATGSLTSRSDYDMYKIITPENGLFSLYGFSHDPAKPADAVFYSESNGAYNFACESDEDEFYCSQVVRPGTYYVQISSYNGTSVNGEEYSFFTTIDKYGVNRISGPDRYETALRIADAGWWPDGAEDIILATGQNFPDALAAGPLAYAMDAPILLTPRDQLPSSMPIMFQNLSVKRVTIIGGTGVVSQQVEDYLRNTLKLTVTRIAGKDRFETASLIAKKLPASSKAIVVNGRNYPDALSVSPYAAQNGIPILLSDTNTLPVPTAEILSKAEQTMVIGGTGAISDSVYRKLPDPTRIGGKNRYETSLMISEYMPTHSIFIATGSNFADALSGSALAAFYGESIILTPPTALPQQTKEYLEASGALSYTILGGKGAISEQIEDELWELVGDGEIIEW